MICLYMGGNIDFIGETDPPPPPGQFRSLYIPAFLGLRKKYTAFERRKNLTVSILALINSALRASLVTVFSLSLNLSEYLRLDSYFSHITYII